MPEQGKKSPYDILVDVVESYEAMSAKASELIARLISNKPDAILCLATGSTPTRAYELVGQRYKRGEFSTGQLRIVKLDEWCGLPMTDHATCEVYLQSHVLAPLAISPEGFVSFRSDPHDPEIEVARVQKVIDAFAPFNLIVLGLGKNGHIGFNEPNAELTEQVHVAQLQETTPHHPMVLNSTGVHHGMTVGMKDILRSEEILLLVSGAEKAQQLRQLVRGPVTAAFPASFLRKHRRLRVIADKDAVDAVL
jgi:galactosamine-6-phosphate isomerase